MELPKTMNLVQVQFRDRKSGVFSGVEFSYIADVPLQKGDVVNVPTKYGNREGCISRTDVPVTKICCRVGQLLHITEAPTIGTLFTVEGL